MFHVEQRSIGAIGARRVGFAQRASFYKLILLRILYCFAATTLTQKVYLERGLFISLSGIEMTFAVFCFTWNK
jgi:hypothetical protein